MIFRKNLKIFVLSVHNLLVGIVDYYVSKFV